MVSVAGFGWPKTVAPSRLSRAWVFLLVGLRTWPSNDLVQLAHKTVHRPFSLSSAAAFLRVMTLRKLGWKEGRSLVESGVSVFWFAGKRSELFYVVLSIQKKDRCLFLCSKAVWSSYRVKTLRKLEWKEGRSLVESGVLCVLICWETKWTFLCSVVYTEKRPMPFLMK
jgi:hypothetical protein